MQNHAQNDDFERTLSIIAKYGFRDEFLVAVREEDEALQKIIEAYDNRMNRKS